MNVRLCALLLGALFPALTSFRQPPAATPPSPAPNGVRRGQWDARRVHDPCIIRDGATYYVFATGPGIPVSRSRDLRHWEPAGRVFPDAPPAWINAELPNARGIWAPDISFADGRFHLYYAVSSFGSNRSLIGMASNKTLDAASPDYKWVDEGKVFESRREDNFNAIDPNVLHAPDGRVALTFGSFWSGIKLVMVDAKTGKPEPQAKVIGLAQRPAPDALEAPFLIYRNGYYYLFVSFDFCCRGVNSTYNIRVGRSRTLTGPYTDRDGKPMLEGGGSVVLTGAGSEAGPGHCAILQDSAAGKPEKGDNTMENGKTGEAALSRPKDYLVYHFYNGAEGGMPTLQLRPLTWTPDGWPTAGTPLMEYSKSAATN